MQEKLSGVGVRHPGRARPRLTAKIVEPVLLIVVREGRCSAQKAVQLRAIDGIKDDAVFTPHMSAK